MNTTTKPGVLSFAAKIEYWSVMRDALAYVATRTIEAQTIEAAQKAAETIAHANCAGVMYVGNVTVEPQA